MINSASLHDDLDVVTSVYLPESTFNSSAIPLIDRRFLSASFTIHQPSFDEQILDPNERILTISTNYTYVPREATLRLGTRSPSLS